jgi:hypothetical protein
MRRVAVVSLLWLSAACTETPTTPSVWTNDVVRDTLITANLNHATAGSRGRLTRWRGTIAVNTNGIARAETALARYEAWSGGLIRFTRVPSNPANGIIFVEGGALGGDGRQGCAHVTDAPPDQSSNLFMLRWDASSAIVGAYTIHLGNAACDDITEGRYPSAYAEHVLAHALGILDHFPGYEGPEGMVDAHAFAVVYNLYANPVGATAQELAIFPLVPRP